ncbi:MAG: CDP-glycerol glycerophosphotransferase family protein [Bacteroidales bacterium]|nr:CDP-glycerol glycerophosphotransferase family protein [Bacteroidales bacterium]
MKFLKYLLSYLAFPFSFLVPRSRKKIAFGSYKGTFDGNAKYLFIEMSEKGGNVVWLSQDRHTVSLIRGLGLKALWLFSLKGAWRALRSKYWIINSYSSDILWAFSGGATVINLWHGVGLKRTEFNSTTGPMYDRYIRRTFKQAFYHPEAYRKPDWLLTASDFQTSMFANAFRIPESRCLKYGYPRNRILVCDEKARTEHISHYEPAATAQFIAKLAGYSEVWIYMPTWRDSQLNVFTEQMDLSALNKTMSERNALLLLKPHPNTIIGPVEGLSNIMLIEGQTDVYPILPYTSALITDYSSVLYDYILMKGKGVVLYTYDRSYYVKERDFYYPFDENVIGRRAETFDDLMKAVVEGPEPLDETERKALVEKFWGTKPFEYDFSNCLHI